MKRLLLMLLLSSLTFAQTKINPSQVRAPSGTASVTQFLTCVPSSTCAFSQGGVVPNPQTGTTYTVATTDRLKYVTFSNGSAIAVTLPQAGTSGFANNYAFVACDIGAGTATITPTTSTISSSNGSSYTAAAATLALITGQCAWIYSNNTDYFAIVRSGITTPVSVANGGTGATTLTNHGVLLGQTTSAIVATSAGSSGQVLTSNGASADPTFQAATGGSVPFITGTVFCTTGAWSGTIFGPITGSGGTNCGDAGAARASAIPGSYTAKNMYVAVFDASDIAKTICASCTIAVTLVLNSSDQALTCTVGNSASSCNDTTHTVAVTAGQVLLWRVVATGTFAGTEQNLSISAQLQ